MDFLIDASIDQSHPARQTYAATLTAAKTADVILLLPAPVAEQSGLALGLDHTCPPSSGSSPKWAVRPPRRVSIANGPGQPHGSLLTCRWREMDSNPRSPGWFLNHTWRPRCVTRCNHEREIGRNYPRRPQSAVIAVGRASQSRPRRDQQLKLPGSPAMTARGRNRWKRIT